MLEVRSLSKSFGALQATRNVSFAVPAGSRYGIVGPNGSGKTTLFNLLTGELVEDDGEILLHGKSLKGLPPDARVRAGLSRSFQRNSLFDEFTVRQNLLTAVVARRKLSTRWSRRLSRYGEVHEEVERLAHELGLKEVIETPAKQLPYGTQRQLELGLALATKPSVLLLDEPTAGMSPEETQAVTDLIRRLSRNTTLIIVEHDMSVLYEIAERLIVLDYGCVLLEGTPAEVRNSELVRRRYFGD